MKEFWMTLGCFLSLVNGPRGFAFGVTDHSPRKNSSSVSIHVHDINVRTIENVSSPFLNTATQWTSTTAPLLQTTKRLNSKTIIASNNKANEFSVTVASEAILPSLSTFFVAKTQINEVDNSALSTNVPPENLATKYTSLNIQNDFFSAKEIKEHSLAVSSNPSVMTPEIAKTTSTSVNGIILPSSSVDKRYLSTSQTGDNSNGDNTRGAFMKSAFSDLHVHREGLNSAQTAQFSSSNSILGQISVALYDTSALANDGSGLFTKGSVSLTKLPRTFLLSSRTIWKTAELNPRRDETTLLFSSKADTSQSHNTRSDTNMRTASTTRAFSSISGMSQTTLVAKITPDENDFASTIFPPSRATQMVASSVVHSANQREVQSSVSSVVMASPSASTNTRRLSSQSSSTTMTISATPMIKPDTSRINSKFSSKPQNEFRTLTTSYNEQISNRMSSTVILNNSQDSTSDSATKESASISFNETAMFIPQRTMSLSDVSTSTLAEKTSSPAVAGVQTQSLYSKTGEATKITETLVAETFTNVKPSLQAPGNLSSLPLSSTKSEVMTEWQIQSNLQSTDWISFTSSDNFSGVNTNSYHQSQISRSSSGIGGHEIRFSSTQTSAVTRKLPAPSASYWMSRSQIPHKESSAATASYHKPLMSGSTSQSEHQIFFSSSRSAIMSTKLIAPSSSRMKSSSSPLNRSTPMSDSYHQPRLSKSTSEIGHQTHFSSSQNPVMSTEPRTEVVAPSSSYMKSSSLIPQRSFDVTSSYHQLEISKSTSEIGHQIHFSSSQNPIMSTEVATPSSSHMKSHSPLQRSSVVTSSYHHSQMSKSTSEIGHPNHFSSSQNPVMSTELVATSSSHMKSRSQIPHQRSSTVSEHQNLSPSLWSTVSKFQTSSSAVSATPPRREEFTSEIIVPLPGESTTSYKAASSQLGVTVIPTQTSSQSGATVNPTQPTSNSAIVTGNVSTESPTTVAADSGHIKLLIVVAIIPSIILFAFFLAFLFYRRNRKRKNKAVYSIKLEYADENNGFRKRCVNSRLDLSLKGIHIDLEFPNAPGDRERHASYARDSASFSRGSNLSETQMRELQILSQECKENMEWISEVIAREMEASICGRPVNRDSVYSVKEKENYEPSEKVIRRESSKRGRETVKWRVPVVQRRDSDEFDQRDSICTDDTTLFPDDWKERQRPDRSLPRNGTEDNTKINQNSNPPVKENGDKVNLDKELRVQLSNKKLDELQSQEKDKKEKELEENKPLTVNLNPEKEDTSRVAQVKRATARPRRFETL